MTRKAMFAQEQCIRDALSRHREAVLYEQDRYRQHCVKPTANAMALEAWKKRISAYTKTSNLLADYLSDFTLNQHGVLKYVRQLEEEIRVAKTTLLYLDRLHAERTKRKAVELAEQIAYQVMGEQVDLVEPKLMALWSEAVDKELALYEQMTRERRLSDE